MTFLSRIVDFLPITYCWSFDILINNWQKYQQQKTSLSVPVKCNFVHQIYSDQISSNPCWCLKLDLSVTLVPLCPGWKGNRRPFWWLKVAVTYRFHHHRHHHRFQYVIHHFQWCVAVSSVLLQLSGPFLALRSWVISNSLSSFPIVDIFCWANQIPPPSPPCSPKGKWQLPV